MEKRKLNILKECEGLKEAVIRGIIRISSSYCTLNLINIYYEQFISYYFSFLFLYDSVYMCRENREI